VEDQKVAGVDTFQGGMKRMAAAKKSAEVPVDVPSSAVSGSIKSGRWWRVGSPAPVRLGHVADVIDRTAPTPGAIVCMMARELSPSRRELRPVLFSALDVNTHLQVARFYLTKTKASAVDFLQFARESFPFRIVRICTPAEPPFVTSSDCSSSIDLSRIAERQGIVYTSIRKAAHEELFRTLSRLTFGWFVTDSLSHLTESDLVRELVNFLFFHNNHRSLPSLAGMTPLQKLKTMGRYQHLQSFDPFSSQTGWR
jgi:hypothetical protein